MSYADGLLSKDESIVRRDHQHWIFPFYIAGKWVAIAAIVTVAGIVLSGFVLRPSGSGIISGALELIDNVIRIVTVIALLIAVVGFIYSIIQWKTQEYLLTTHRVLHVHGVINKQSSDSSLENITDAAIRVPWLGRILGFGDLKVMTASEAGINRLRALREPIEFKKAMMEAKTAHVIMLNTPRSMQTAAGGGTPVAAQAPVAAPPPPAPVFTPAPAPVPAPAAEAAVVGDVAAAASDEVPAAAPDAPTESTPVVADESPEEITRTLASLATLRDSGAITPEEFEAKKQELLDRL